MWILIYNRLVCEFLTRSYEMKYVNLHLFDNAIS